MAISEQWAELLEPGLREIFMQAEAALAAESRIPALFDVIPSGKAAEKFLSVGGMGNWNAYKGAIEYDDLNKGYETTITHEEYVRGFVIERKLVEDDQYNMFRDRPEELAMAAMRTRETHAASVFNNAFSASYLGGDGKPLCEDDHPASPSNSATQDNEGALAFSYDNVIATRLLMRAYEDDRGNLIPRNPDTILVPPELEQTAFEMFPQNNNKPNTADSVANFARSFIRNVIAWDYLTDANAWFLIDSRAGKQALKWVERTPLEFALDPTSDFNLQSKWRGYMRYSYGFKDWRWVYGNNPS